jgi:hypothetical protein
MPIYKVNLGFVEKSDPALDAFTESLIAKITGNPSFPTPPVTAASLETELSDFTDALAAAADGGKEATAIKDAARASLIEALRKDAIYVQAHGNNDLATLLSSGYEVSSTSRTRSPLPAPTIVRVDNGTSTNLLVSVTVVPNAKAYEAQISTDGGTTWEHATISTRARPITVPGLTPGTTYLIQVRAVGGTTGFSGFSDPVSHMAT